MDIAGLLNADIRTVGRLIERGVRWWLDELRAMVPERWRPGDPARAIIRLSGDGFHAEDATGGPLAVAECGKAALCLPNHAGLIRRMDLPLLSGADSRRLIALDIERLAPFEAGQVLFDLFVESRDQARQTVLVGILPREEAGTALDRAQALGLTPSALMLADGDGRPRFDFLPALREGGGAAKDRWAGGLRALVAALLLLNPVVFVVRDMLSVETLRQQVDAAKPMVQTAETLLASVEREAARRKELVRRKEVNSPLPILDGLSRSLPDDVWIRRFEWDGATVRVAGWTRGDADVLALIESTPLLTDARPVAAAAIQAPSRAKPFEITARRKPVERP